MHEIGLLPALKDSLIKRTSYYDFIIQPFILRNNGQFLYPNFIGITENPPATRVIRQVHFFLPDRRRS